MTKCFRSIRSRVSGVRTGRNLLIWPKNKLDFLIISTIQLLQKTLAHWDYKMLVFFCSNCIVKMIRKSDLFFGLIRRFRPVFTPETQLFILLKHFVTILFIAKNAIFCIGYYKMLVTFFGENFCTNFSNQK